MADDNAKTRRSSSASNLTRCSRSRMAWPKMDWGGTAAFRPCRRPALIERRIAAVLAAVPRLNRAPASFGPRYLVPLRARPALGVSVGEQQSHYCDTEQNKTDRAHDGRQPFNNFEALTSGWGISRPEGQCPTLAIGR